MAELKERLHADMVTSLKARDSIRTSTLRMVLTAITEAEVSGKTAKELTADQELEVVIKEAKKRRESEEAYTAAGRSDLADKEHAEAEVLADYLPQQLGADEIAELVKQAIAETGAAELGPRGIGKVMGVLTPKTKGKADGGAVAAEVKRQLTT